MIPPYAVIEDATITPHQSSETWLSTTTFFFEGSSYAFYYMLGSLHDYTEADARLNYVHQRLIDKAIEMFLKEVRLSGEAH